VVRASRNKEDTRKTRKNAKARASQLLSSPHELMSPSAANSWGGSKSTKVRHTHKHSHSCTNKAGKTRSIHRTNEAWACFSRTPPIHPLHHHHASTPSHLRARSIAISLERSLFVLLRSFFTITLTHKEQSRDTQSHAHPHHTLFLPLLFTALLVRCCRCCLPLSSSDNKQMKKEIKEGNDCVYLYKSGRERRRRRWKHLKQTKERIQHAKIQPKNKRAPPGLAIGLTAFINSSFTTSVLCLCNSPLYLLTFKEPSMFHTLPPSIPPSLPSSLPPSPHRPPLHPLRNSKRSRQARALDPHTIDDALHPSLPPSLPPSLGKR